MCTTCNDEINNGLIPTGATGPQGAIGPAGPTGPQGPQGDPGPAGTQERIIFQSTSAPSILNGVSLSLGANTFTGLETNLFKDATTRQYVLWIDMNITALQNHLCEFYFLKNGFQVTPIRKFYYETHGQIHFKTALTGFANTDVVGLYINTTTDTAIIDEVVLHSIWQV